MLVTARPSLAPGVVAAATAPITVLFASWLLVTWTGGPHELSRLMSAAGPFASLVVLSALVELAFLTLMVCHIGAGRLVPLAVMLGMATLPWTMGLLGTETIVGRTVAALGGMDASDARNALALGVGEAMASRMLGAWMSAALLMGLGLGLAMAASSLETPWRPAPRGSIASLLFGVIVAFVLAAIALVGALEAHQLFALLTHLPQAPLSERVSVLSEAAEDMSSLRPIRQACQALLATLGGVLFLWRARRAASPARGWMGSAFLAAAITSLLVLDAHPLHLAEQRARKAGLDSIAVPTGFQALHILQASTPRPLAALASLESVVPSAGHRLSWSSPPKELAEALSASLHSAAGEPTSTGAIPEPVMPLLVDARLSGSAVRRLLEASSLAGAHSVELVGQHPHAASPATVEWLEARQPLFALLAARAGTLQLLLPSAVQEPFALSWRARFDGRDTLRLTPVQGGETLTLSLRASPAEVPEVLAGRFVGLEISDEVSLKELGAAAQVLELAGASTVALLDSESRVAWPAHGGTATLWSTPVPGLLAPAILRRAAEIRRHGLEVLRRAMDVGLMQAQRPLARPLVAATQSIRKSITTATITPIPNTTSITTPSYLEDRGTFGAASEVGSIARCVGAVGSGSVGRSAAWVTTEDSRSSRPSRASASTRFIWSM
jgi:hypothetical protein